MHDIRPFLPQLFSNPGTLLYVGARVDAHSWLEELHLAGNQIVIVEAWKDNFDNLIDSRRFDWAWIVLSDIAQYTPEMTFDYIFYWHGPEHLPMPEIEPTLQKLESKCNHLIALACPYGLYPQSAHAGNPYEVHQSTLYPEFFEALGYKVKIDGLPDEAGSEIVAWKVISD